MKLIPALTRDRFPLSYVKRKIIADIFQLIRFAAYPLIRFAALPLIRLALPLIRLALPLICLALPLIRLALPPIPPVCEGTPDMEDTPTISPRTLWML